MNLLLNRFCPSDYRRNKMRKLLLIMRITVILLLFAIHVGATGYSQNVTLSLKNADLEQAFKEIRKQTGYNFLYNDDWLKEAKKVSITVNNVPLKDALDKCFEGQPFTYTIIEKTISLKLKEVKSLTTDYSQLPIPPIDVHGRVINENGDPVEGVSVKIKGTDRGTATNTNGEFSLANVDDNAILVFTGVNIESFEQKIGGRGELLLSAKNRISNLQEVIVDKGYYSVKQRDNTGNIAIVKGEDIRRQPTNDPILALESRVSGLFIKQASGVPGSSFAIQLRGQNSIANGNDPLFIVDGVPFTSNSLTSPYFGGGAVARLSPFSNINPSDIENIEVLKDADATAIYGSRGANGVILINTKRAKAGKTSFDINFYSGVGQVAKKMDLLNSVDYVKMRREGFHNDNLSSFLIPAFASYVPDILVWDTTRYTDWQKVFIGGKAKITNAQVSISGGNSNTQFLIGGGYHRETTVFPGSFGDQNSSAHFNLNNTSENKRFKTNFSASFLSDYSNLPTVDVTRYITLPPDAPSIYTADGNLNWQNSSWENPFGKLAQKADAKTVNLIGNMDASYQILSALQLKCLAGYNYLQMAQNIITPLSSFDPRYASTSTLRSNSFANNNLQTWNFEPQINYTKSLSSSEFNVLIGTTIQQRKQVSLSQLAYDFSSDALIDNITAASTIKVLGYAFNQYRYNAVYGRFNYKLKDKYLVNLTGRRDGSSRFGPGKQFGNFGAIGIGWILSSEKFVKQNISFLNYAKLRASYGSSGNDQLTDYQYLSSYSSFIDSYQGLSGLYPTRIANPEYSWETIRKLEVGLEIGILNNKVFINASFYRHRTSNQLVGYSLPTITGFNSIIANLPAIVQNSGGELELNFNVIRNKKIDWVLSGNLTLPRNKLVDYPNLSGSSYANNYEIGKSLFIRKAYNYLGVDPSNGLAKFLDVDKDNKISYPQDLTSNKEISQNYYGGIQNSIRLKKWQLDLLFQFVKQTGYNYVYQFSKPGSGGNQPVEILGRWQKPGDITNIPAFTAGFGGPTTSSWSNLQVYGDNVIADASFVRLKNLSLSYLVATSALKKLNLKNFRLYIQGANLITITHYNGLDPENQFIGALPPLRILTGGIQITL